MAVSRILTSCSRSLLRTPVLLSSGARVQASTATSAATHLDAITTGAGIRGFASDGPSGGNSWLPAWLRFPGSGGGGGGGGSEEEFTTMTLDTFKNNLGRARMAGALTGMVGGNKQAGNQGVRAQLQMFEDIIGSMTPEERANPSTLFGAAERARVAASVKCSKAQVDDCITKFESMNKVLATLSARKKAGKPMPTSVSEMNALVGGDGWGGQQQQQQQQQGRRGRRGRQQVAAGASGAAAASGSPAGPAKGPDGQPCPLAGRPNVGRNDVCPLTHQKYKRCCGRAA